MEAAIAASAHPLYRERYQQTKRRRQRGPKVAQIDLARRLTGAKGLLRVSMYQIADRWRRCSPVIAVQDSAAGARLAGGPRRASVASLRPTAAVLRASHDPGRGVASPGPAVRLSSASR
jgi:hypothetical protein